MTEANGEVDDVRAAVDWLTEKFGLPVLFAGFSFGANVGTEGLLRRCAGARAGGAGAAAAVGGEGLQLQLSAGVRERAEAVCQRRPRPSSVRRECWRVLATAGEPKKIVWVEGADHFFAGTLSRRIRSWA
jgi:alpha/beta superfamily hydrolase